MAAIALLAGVFLFVALAFTGSGPAEAQAPYPGHPGPVQNLKVVPGETANQLTVTWSAPSNTGGHIDKYQIEASGTSNAAVPGAVQNLAVMGSLKSIFISWDAPSDNGGSAITKY